MNTRNTRALIDLNALKYNYQHYMEKTGHEVFAVVKANAYGHGDVLVAKALEHLVKVFCVSSLDEAIHLKENGIQNDILIFSHVDPKHIEKYQDSQFIYTIGSFNWFQKIKNLNIRTHIKVDTGMNRFGIKDFNEVRMILRNQKDMVEGIYTHFSSSDDNLNNTFKQLKMFESLIETLDYEFQWIHAANTHASGYVKSSILNASRIGIGLYGYEKDNHKIKQVMDLQTEIIQIHTIKKGESVGYNQTYTASEDEMIATLPIGYADGFDVRMKSVYINDRKYPVVGKICMDQCMVKIDGSVKLYDTVKLFSDYESMAIETDIMPYILMTCVSSRVSRQKKSSSD